MGLHKLCIGLHGAHEGIAGWWMLSENAQVASTSDFLQDPKPPKSHKSAHVTDTRKYREVISFCLALCCPEPMKWAVGDDGVWWCLVVSGDMGAFQLRGPNIWRKSN